MNNILKIKLSEEIPQKAKDSTLDEKKKLCERLGLKAQAKMCKASALGTRVIRREDISGILNIDTREISYFEVSEFLGEIPFGVLLKIDELKEEKLFFKVGILAKRQIGDPLLIGEILLKDDGQCSFWHRDTIVCLIAQWE